MQVSKRLGCWRASILVSCAIVVHTSLIFSQPKGQVAIGINYQNFDDESRNKIEKAKVALETRVKDADLVSFPTKESTGLQSQDFEKMMISRKIKYGIFVDLKSEGSSIDAKYILLDNRDSTQKVVVERRFSKSSFIKNEFINQCLKIIEEIPPPTKTKPWYVKRWREILGGSALAAAIIAANRRKDKAPNDLPAIQ